MARNTFGWDLNAALAPEEVFGVAAESGTYVEVPFYTHGLTRNQPLDDDPVIGERLVRAPHKKVEGLIDHGGQWVCPFDLGNAGLYLRGLLGVPETTGDENYTHVFKPGGGELISHTLQERVSATRFMQHRGLIVNGLSGQLSRQGGYQRLNVDFKGATESVIGASAAGAIGAPLTVDRLMGFHGVIKRGGNAEASIASANWAFTNNVEAYDAPGQAHVAGYDPGVPGFTATITARATAAGHALYDLANAGTRFTLALEWSLGLNNSLTFEIGNAVLAPSSKPVNGPAGQQYQFEVSAEPDDAEEDDAFFVATLKNQIASYALPDWS